MVDNLYRVAVPVKMKAAVLQEFEWLPEEDQALLKVIFLFFIKLAAPWLGRSPVLAVFYVCLPSLTLSGRIESSPPFCQGRRGHSLGGVVMSCVPAASCSPDGRASLHQVCSAFKVFTPRMILDGMKRIAVEDKGDKPVR